MLINPTVQADPCYSLVKIWRDSFPIHEILPPKTNFSRTPPSICFSLHEIRPRTPPIATLPQVTNYKPSIAPILQTLHLQFGSFRTITGS